MEEWQKTLLSAGMGFLAGVLAEPIKAGIAVRRKRATLSAAIDSAMIDTCRMLFEIWAHPDATTFQAELPFDRFDHYFKQEKADFYYATASWFVVEFFEAARPLILNAEIEESKRRADIEALLVRMVGAAKNEYPRIVGKLTRGYLLRVVAPRFLPCGTVTG